MLGGFLLIIGGCVSTCAYIGYKKAKEYSGDAGKNPQLAAIAMAASLSPNLQVVSKNVAAGKLTIKNKQTGEVVTLDLNNYSAEEMGKAVERLAKGQKALAPAESNAEANESAAAEPSEPAEAADGKASPARGSAQAATLKKFPDFIAVYPGAETLESALSSFGGNSIGNYAFSTRDATDKVADFYEKKLTSAGFTIMTKAINSDDNGATATMMANRGDPQTVVTLMAKIDGEKTRVEIGFTRANGN